MKLCGVFQWVKLSPVRAVLVRAAVAGSLHQAHPKAILAFASFNFLSSKNITEYEKIIRFDHCRDCLWVRVCAAVEFKLKHFNHHIRTTITLTSFTLNSQ